jgi:hypothetical protein
MRLSTSTATMARNLIALVSRATPAEVATGSDWYPAMAAVMAEHARVTGLTPHACAAVYAATSINTPWQRNLALAARGLADYADGRPILADGGTLGHSIRTARAAVAAPDSAGIDAALTGGSGAAVTYKLRNFARNLSGDMSAVTCDRWAWRAATAFDGCTDTGATHGCGAVPTGAAYVRMARAYRVAARRLGLTPAAVQAIAWVMVRGSGD